MYVDKKLAGVNAVQTLSRLNRTHPGKDDTFVLDFANDAEEIQDAFQPYYEQTVAPPTDPNLLYTAQREVKEFAPRRLGDSRLRRGIPGCGGRGQDRCPVAAGACRSLSPP